MTIFLLFMGASQIAVLAFGLAALRLLRRARRITACQSRSIAQLADRNRDLAQRLEIAEAEVVNLRTDAEIERRFAVRMEQVAGRLADETEALAARGRRSIRKARKTGFALGYIAALSGSDPRVRRWSDPSAVMIRCLKRAGVEEGKA